MFCSSCGKQIADASRFCPYCGTSFSAAAEAAPDAAPEKQPKNNKTLFIVLGSVVAFVLILFVVLLSIFNTPTMKVARALGKTAGAYADAAGDLKIPDYAFLTEEKACNVSLSMEVVNIKELSGSTVAPTVDSEVIDATPYGSPTTTLAQLLPGFGVRFNSALSIPERDMSISITPYYNSMDLINAELGIQDTTLFLHAPELLGDSFFGLDTLTVGKELVEKGALEPEFSQLGFDFFELIQIVEEYQTMDPEQQEALEEASEILAKSIEIEKAGKEKLRVNGKDTRCAVYTVTITEDALDDYLHALEDILEQKDMDELYNELYKAMGIPKEIREEIMGSITGADASYEVYLDILDELLNEIGDLEIDLYISKGYISAAVWEFEVDGDDYSVSAYLGGGDNYVDDLSLVLTNDDIWIILSSTGNHSGKGGVYTDTLTLSTGDDEDDTEAILTAELRYAPKEESDNLSIELDAQEFGSLSVTGNLLMNELLYQLELEELVLSIDDEIKITAAASYMVAPYAPVVSVSSPVMLLEMEEAELMELMPEIMENMTSLQTKLEGILPAELLDNIF